MWFALQNADISPSEAKGSHTLPISASGEELLAWILCVLLCPAVQGRPHPELPQKFMKILSSQTLLSRDVEWVPPTQCSCGWSWTSYGIWERRGRRFSPKYLILLFLILFPIHEWVKIPYYWDPQKKKCSSHSFCWGHAVTLMLKTKFWMQILNHAALSRG